MLYWPLYVSTDTDGATPPNPPAACRREESAISTHPQAQQADLIAGLLGALDRNRFALVLLAASMAAGARSRAAGARSRAREACAESGAARWLARHAHAVRQFIASLSTLHEYTAQAGYRALGRARPLRRLLAAPRRLGIARVARAPLVAPVRGGPAGPGLMALPARL